MPKPKGTNEIEKQIIWRGLLAGAAAGVLAFGFARIPSNDQNLWMTLGGAA
ncbi:hypothetical protein [Mycolicibacterium gilvum]|uniref:hypothetical protein n=1 Tax=Mycolicibacterium gilvum TaxID=1804 RepID=UPI0040452253